jgi:hypothetical protein
MVNDRFKDTPVKVYSLVKPEKIILDCNGKRYTRRFEMRESKEKVHKKLLRMIKTNVDKTELVKFFLASNENEKKIKPFAYVSADLPKPVKHSKEFIAKKKKIEREKEKIKKQIIALKSKLKELK